MERCNPFAINGLRTLSRPMEGRGLIPLQTFQPSNAHCRRFSPHPGFLCFHALTNCPIYKPFVFLSIQQWGWGWVGGATVNSAPSTVNLLGLLLPRVPATKGVPAD